MQPGTVVRIRNTSPDRTWKDGYDGITYTALPGGEVIASFEAACLWFGHPEAVDMGPGKTYRSDEYMRLRTRYGVMDVLVEDPTSGHSLHQDHPCCPLTQEQQWERNIPPIEVFTIDGERIITVMDDPDGASVTPASTSVAQQEVLTEQLAAMREQMRHLQAQIDSQSRSQTAEQDSGPIATDEPDLIGSEGNTVGAEQGAVPDPEVTVDAPTRVRVGSNR